MITLSEPIEMGDLANRITVQHLEIVAIAINLQAIHVAQGNAALSLILEDPDTGWQTTITYRDASALAFWGALDESVTLALLQAVWDKLAADGKLPAGNTEVAIPSRDLAVAALATQNAAKLAKASPATRPPEQP